MRVHVDRAKCVGHGRCYVLAPDVFEDDERGHCVVRKTELPAEFEEQKARLLRSYRDEPRRDSDSSRARAAASARDPTPNFR